LINIDKDVDEFACLDVNNMRHTWKTNGPLFIFDDTVLHKSFNLSDKVRTNLFIDATRPTLFPFLINAWNGCVPLKIDWLAGKGGKVVNAQTIEKPQQNGILLSDHNPIFIDLNFV
jgi:hypothetical protein